MPLLAYDIEKRKVGCVLLQAVYGGDSQLAQQIPVEDWLIAPSPGLQLYRLTDDEATKLVAMHNKRNR